MFLICVEMQEGFQAGHILESLGALATGKWPHAAMFGHMFVKCTLRAKLLPTPWAKVYLVLPMNLYMSEKVLEFLEE